MSTVKCKECDHLIFSAYYQGLGYCPECVLESEEPLDLEDRLDAALSIWRGPLPAKDQSK